VANKLASRSGAVSMPRLSAAAILICSDLEFGVDPE